MQHFRASCLTCLPWACSASGEPTPGKAGTLFSSTVPFFKFLPSGLPCALKGPTCGNPAQFTEPPSSGSGSLSGSLYPGDHGWVSEGVLEPVCPSGVHVNTYGERIPIREQLPPCSLRALQSKRLRSALQVLPRFSHCQPP